MSGSENGFGHAKLDTEKHCPFSFRLHPDCYCYNMDSRKIVLALQYCLGDFKKCDVYQRLTDENRKEV